MFFSSHYVFPLGILELLNDVDLIELSCTSRRAQNDTAHLIVARKKRTIQRIMNYFHTPGGIIFSLHRHYMDDFELHIRRLFKMIPEWFQYIEDHDIAYLDISNPFHTSFTPRLIASRILSSRVTATCEDFMNHLSQNTTLSYCNLGLLHHFISRYRVEQAVAHHPTMNHVELLLYSVDTNSATSLYRMSDGSFTWRHYPPRN